MDSRIKEIYENIIQQTYFREDLTSQIQEEIERLLTDDRQSMAWTEYEDYRGKVIMASTYAEECGFIKGFQYAVELLLSGADCKH